VTDSSEARVLHDPADLRLAAKAVRLTASGLPGGSDHADRLEAWADLAPLEAAVLDALSEADLRRAWSFLRFGHGMEAAQLAERLRIAADALAALKAKDPTNNTREEQ
jgi:hypothetical protein